MYYSIAIGKEMGLDKEQMEMLKLVAIIHDIGKIGVRDAVLFKEVKITDEEFAIIKAHTIYGAEILQHVKNFNVIIPGVKYHHEKFNGTGYPEKLKVEEISLIARIIAVADNFDAMTTDRPYRKGRSFETAIKELKNKAGTQFDPEAVKCFIRVFEKRNLKNED